MELCEPLPLLALPASFRFWKETLSTEHLGSYVLAPAPLTRPRTHVAPERSVPALGAIIVQGPPCAITPAITTSPPRAPPPERSRWHAPRRGNTPQGAFPPPGPVFPRSAVFPRPKSVETRPAVETRIAAVSTRLGV